MHTTRFTASRRNTRISRMLSRYAPQNVQNSATDMSAGMPRQHRVSPYALPATVAVALALDTV
eukprot:366239-Chlamydomonas_euryale.AAC.19